MKVTLERPEPVVKYKTVEDKSKKEAEEMTDEYSHLNQKVQQELNEFLGIKDEEESR